MSGFRRVTRSKAAEERNRDSENINEASPGLSKNDKDFKSAAAKKETQSKKSEHKESKDATDLSSVSSKLSPRQETTEDNSREETSSTVLVRVGEPDNSSESEKEATEMSRKHLSAKDKILDPAGPDVTSVNDKKTTIEVSTEDDLDEMMDIGTVDQVEQEAQMQEEEQNSFMDVDSSQSCHVFTSPATGDANFIKEEDDVKPTGLQPPSDEDQGCRSTASSEAIAGRDSSSPASLMNGMNVVKLDKVSNEIKLSISPSLVKVKDEPADDEYEQALISCESTATVKDEPNIAKEDLRIGSVFSVTAESQTLPTINPSSLQMFCSHCKKNLLKGQTAFQRKGSPALFCSTTCLSTSLPAVKGLSKFCHHCQKLLLRPLDTVLAPDEKGTMKEFCSQNCLTSFNHKNSTAKKTPQSPAPQSLCSMCTKHCISKHEVILNSTAHKLCSDTCFKRFRTVNNLSMANCANCEVYCHSKPLLLKLEGGNKILCNLECLSKYKKTNKTNQPCTMCHTTRLLAEMVYNRNTDDSVNLFCSSSCVMAFKVQTVSTSGARVDCDCCGKKTVPAYHLAMSDTSIRNFCTLPCVMNFQEKFRKSQKHVNVFTKLPTGPIKNQAITLSQPPQHVSKEARNLSCSQCNSIITFKPEVIQIKDNLYFVCNADCSHELKKAYSVTCVCEYCKMEKISRDAKRINNRDCFFCSDGCELLFRHDLNKNWGKHCTSCTYCHSVSQKLVTAQYGGSTEEFCSEGCRSKYTMLFCHVAMCDTCGRKGKLKQSLPMLGEVKNFCDLTCLLQFCCDKAAMQSEVLRGPSGTREATPVIANVISLAGAKSNASDRTALQSIKEHTGRTPNFLSKKSGHISIQTDTLKSHCPPGQKMLKNKALLCRPLVQNKGVSCKTQMVDCEAQTDGAFPQIMIVPVPVPVYIPVPMNMYTQCTPRPVGLPLPVPVPMFLPVTIDSAERIVETIQEIKEKIPSDPFEAEIILMAEMVAEQEGTADKEETPKEKEVERETEKRIEPATDDHASNYSDDLDTDDLASFLNNWEDASSDTGLTSPSQHCSNEKLNPSLDSPVGTSSEHSPEAPPPAPPTMDIEADVTVESLEKLAQLREQSQRSLSPPPSTERRRQAPRKAREKKGRKSQRLSETVKVSSQRHSSIKPKVYDIPKLKSQYGVDAWKRWILWRRNQHDLEKPRFARSLEMKEDVLRCTTAELSYGLCCFINEIRRPNGEPYSPDSLFYLCLGIQQHLFENGRVENIFMDRFYNKFSIEFTNMLRSFKPSITARGYIHSRVEEEFLWDCKQLGAYSPIVLLNTLLFFCCKYFGFTMVEQHRQLSFAHVMRCTKTNQDNSKTIFLRFYPPIPVHETEPEVPTKRRKEEQSKEDVLEMMENTENPLRCPVRLYEFYLSKCSESVKQRTNMFYLHPERSCVPNSPLWFSSTPLEDSTIEAMLIRILTVRELHTTTKKEDETEQDTSDDPSFIPDDEDSE